MMLYEFYHYHILKKTKKQSGWLTFAALTSCTKLSFMATCCFFPASISLCSFLAAFAIILINPTKTSLLYNCHFSISLHLLKPFHCLIWMFETWSKWWIHDSLVLLTHKLGICTLHTVVPRFCSPWEILGDNGIH